MDAICAATGWPESRVRPHAESPWIQKQVAALVRDREIKASDPDEVLERETANTLAKIVNLRDTGEDDKVQLAAAKELFDRQRPKITKVEEERTVRITIEKGDMDAAKVIEGEVKLLDAETE